jgi:hypothetical protein
MPIKTPIKKNIQVKKATTQTEAKPNFSRIDGRYLTRTNRTVYFGTKVTPEFDETIRRLAHEKQCLITEMLESFMNSYLREEESKVKVKIKSKKKTSKG